MARAQKFFVILRGFLSARGGNVAMIFAFVVPVIAVLVASSLEIGNTVKTRNALQNVLDSAVLAASRSGSLSDGELTAAAQAFVDANRSTSLGDLDIAVDVDSVGEVGDLTIIGDASLELPSLFGAVLDRTHTRIEVRSEVRALEDPQLQLALVLDTTGSMGGSKIATLRSAATDLVAYIRERVDAPIGVVPFARYVNVGTDNAGEDGIAPPMVRERRGRGRRARWVDVVDPDWDGCVGSPLAPYNVQDGPDAVMPGLSGVDCPSPLLRLTLNQGAVNAAIADLDADGWTYIPSGLMWGWRLLSEAAPFTESPTFLEEPDDEMLRVIVLMTDGANTRAQSTGSSYHNSQSQWRADNLTRDVCSAIKDDDVRIYSVAFEITDAGTRQMIEDCATEPSMYFNASNQMELRQAFSAIARDVVALYISH